MSEQADKLVPVRPAGSHDELAHADGECLHRYPPCVDALDRGLEHCRDHLGAVARRVQGLLSTSATSRHSACGSSLFPSTSAEMESRALGAFISTR